jgi:decaprenylphospho-beta-D-erythro-pentofuranosid-2-ulose 2-reductase
VVAFGVLGDAEKAWTDFGHAVELAETNYVGAVSAGVAVGEAMKRQGHGVIVAMSSVAGERPRRSNFVYGSTKAGLDAFYTGLGEALRPHGVRVLVVRPGFVKTRMTEGLEPAPLSVTASEVADAVVAAIRRGSELIWVPMPLRAVMSGLRHLPRPVFRRLPI